MLQAPTLASDGGLQGTISEQGTVQPSQQCFIGIRHVLQPQDMSESPLSALFQLDRPV